MGVKASMPTLANRGGVDFDQLLVVGQLAERRGDSNFLWHKLKIKSSVQLIDERS